MDKKLLVYSHIYALHRYIFNEEMNPFYELTDDNALQMIQDILEDIVTP